VKTPVSEIERALDRMFADSDLRTSASSAGRAVFDRQLWTTIEQFGILELAESWPADLSGELFAEAAGAVVRLGYYGCRIPLAETLLIAPQARFGLDLATAGAPVCVAIQDDAASPIASSDQGGTWIKISATIKWLAFTESLLIVSRRSEGTLVGHIASKGLTSMSSVSISGEPTSLVEGRLLLPRQSSVFVAGSDIYERVMLLAALCTALQCSGAMERVLELCITHCRSRVQFGQPLGRFQAIQRLLADLYVEVMMTDAAVSAAVAAWSSCIGSPLPREAIVATAAAKSRTSASAGVVARLAHQIHGAIGVTAEHRLSQFTRNLLTWRDENGDESSWRSVITRNVAHEPLPAIFGWFGRGRELPEDLVADLVRGRSEASEATAT
jgi:acyl-CoA dehydrogenase